MTDAAPLTSSGNLGRGLCIVAAGLSVVMAVTGWRWSSPDPQLLLERGLAETEQNRPEAERLLRRSIALTGGIFPDAQLALCRVLLHNDAATETRQLFQLIDCQACRDDLLIAFGRDALKRDQRTEGLAALECAGQRDGPLKIVALDLLLSNYKEWGQQNDQLRIASLLAELDAENPQRWADLIEVQSSASGKSNGVATIQAALEYQFPVGFRRHLQNVLVQQLVNRGDAKAARLALGDLRRLEGDSPQARGFDVYVSRLEGRLDESLRISTAIVDDSPALPFPRFTRGVILIDLHRFADAAADLEHVVAIQPNNAAARFKLSEAYRGLGRDDLALKHQQLASEVSTKQQRIAALLKEREANPFDSSIYQELEQIHRSLGEAETAKYWHQWAIRVARLRQ